MSKKKQKIENNEVVAVEKAPKEKRNYFLEFFSKEYKGENIILLVLALFAIVLGALIISGTLTVDENFFLIGLKNGKVFAWILVSLGAVSLLLVAYPFYRPSFGEIKHLRGYKRSEFFKHSFNVLVFIIVMALVFFLYDLGLDPLMEIVKK